MRHRRKAKYFGVKTAHRKAMFRNMVTSLFRHGRITTTVPRAKELRRLADRMVTLAKEGTLHARRQALSVINDKAVVAKLFSEIAEQMASRNGGYTRIVKVGPRRGDGAMMCIIELVKESLKPKKSRPAKQTQESAPTVIPEAKETPAEEGTEEAAEAAEAFETSEKETEEEAVAQEETRDEGEEPGASEPDGEPAQETLEEPETAQAESRQEPETTASETAQAAETAQAVDGADTEEEAGTKESVTPEDSEGKK